MKKKINLIILSFILFSFSAYAQEFNYSSYIKKFQEYESLSNENFNKLVFALSKKQIKKSASYKLVVQDQLGRDWLFKAGAHSSKDGAIATYRLFQFLGVDTPEIHYKTLSINGEIIPGSLQRVFAAKDFYLPPSFINQKSQMYIARNHALSWLALNHHFHPKQFIYLNSPENGLELLRIDNSVNYPLYGYDQLNTAYVSPMLNHVSNAGYFNFWNDLVAFDVNKTGNEKKITPAYDKPELFLKLLEKKKFILDFESLYSWILFINKIPDNFYGSFFDEIVKNDFLYSSNNSATTPWFMTAEYILNFDKKNFIQNLINRKNSASGDFKKFYTPLIELVHSKAKLDGSQISKISDELNDFLDLKIKASNDEKNKISQAGNKIQSDIGYEISLSTHVVISKVILLPLANNISDKLFIIEEMKKELTSIQMLKKKKSIEYEKIQNALSNIEKVKLMIKENKGSTQIFNAILDYHQLFEKNGLVK